MRSPKSPWQPGCTAAPIFSTPTKSRISPTTREREPFFKPDFSPDLLLSTNYIGRPWFAAAALLRRARCHAAHAAAPRRIRSGAALHRGSRIHPPCSETAVRSVARESLDDRPHGPRRADQAASRRGIEAEVLPGCLPGTWRLRRTTQSDRQGCRSSSRPARRKVYIETCIATLRERTPYPNFEIVCIDNIPDSQMAWKIWLQQNADRIVDDAGSRSTGRASTTLQPRRPTANTCCS